MQTVACVSNPAASDTVTASLPSREHHEHVVLVSSSWKALIIAIGSDGVGMITPFHIERHPN